MIFNRSALAQAVAQLLHHDARGLEVLATLLFQMIHRSQPAVGKHYEIFIHFLNDDKASSLVPSHFGNDDRANLDRVFVHRRTSSETFLPG